MLDWLRRKVFGEKKFGPELHLRDQGERSVLLGSRRPGAGALGVEWAAGAGPKRRQEGESLEAYKHRMKLAGRHVTAARIKARAEAKKRAALAERLDCPACDEERRRDDDGGPGFGTAVVVGAMLAGHGGPAQAAPEDRPDFEPGGGSFGGGGASESFDPPSESAPSSGTGEP